jgi:hypothetical protein
MGERVYPPAPHRPETSRFEKDSSLLKQVSTPEQLD